MTYQFQYGYFFWLLLGLPVLAGLFIWVARWKRRVTRRIGEERLVHALTAGFSPLRFRAKFLLFSAAFALGVVALTNLRRPGGAESILRKGIDVVVALDVSRSMEATDLQPNRLERAKQVILKLMDAMPNDRIGLVLFAGRAYLQMPLTVDHGAAKLFVSSADPDAINVQGTVIADALQMSANAFNPKERRFKSIILLSDGEDFDANALKKAEELASQGVMINTVGIGSPEGAEIIDPVTGAVKKDAQGNTVITRLNEDELRQIAARTHGVYVHLQSSDEAVQTLQAQLAQIDRKAYGDVSLMNFRSYYMWFAVPMFLLLLAELLLSENRKKKPA
ncbi:MAG TPA: VWA domain-containing protein [Chitinophagaceae bacterium]|nr:VWA domain-containing protein [Chitinophagaceae bacterium]